MRDRVGISDGGSSDAPPSLDALLDRLQAGATMVEAGRALNLRAADLIRGLGQVALTMDGPGVPALVQEAPRRPWLAPALAEDAWTELLPRAGRPARLGLAAGLLQIHDCWDASHTAAQEAEDLLERLVSAYWHDSAHDLTGRRAANIAMRSMSTYWHGVAHRREPDPGNAAYWFRRVGRHPVLTRMSQAALPLLEAYADSAMTAKLIRGGNWDPFAFIDLCSTVRHGTSAAALALGLQRVEMFALLNATAEEVARGVGG